MDPLITPYEGMWDYCFREEPIFYEAASPFRWGSCGIYLFRWAWHEPSYPGDTRRLVHGRARHWVTGIYTSDKSFQQRVYRRAAEVCARLNLEPEYCPTKEELTTFTSDEVRRLAYMDHRGCGLTLKCGRDPRCCQLGGEGFRNVFLKLYDECGRLRPATTSSFA